MVSTATLALFSSSFTYGLLFFFLKLSVVPNPTTKVKVPKTVVKVVLATPVFGNSSSRCLLIGSYF